MYISKSILLGIIYYYHKNGTLFSTRFGDGWKINVDRYKKKYEDMLNRYEVSINFLNSMKDKHKTARLPDYVWIEELDKQYNTIIKNQISNITKVDEIIKNLINNKLTINILDRQSNSKLSDIINYFITIIT